MEDELILDMSKTYIYEGLEYILTGRTAKKREETSDLPQRRSKRKAARAPKPIPIMVEIQLSPRRTVQHPAPPSTEKKWVELNDLYMIEDMLDEPEELDEREDLINEAAKSSSTPRPFFENMSDEELEHWIECKHRLEKRTQDDNNDSGD